MKYGVFILVSCIFSMCAKPPEHVAKSDASIKSFSESLTNEHWKVLSLGGFYLDNKVESLYLDLQYDGVMKNSEAEKLLSTYIRSMIRHINRDSELTPFLVKKRFSVKDISISIAYMDAEGKSAQMHLYEGQIVHSLYNKKKNTLEKIYSKPIADLYLQ